MWPVSVFAWALLIGGMVAVFGIPIWILLLDRWVRRRR